VKVESTNNDPSVLNASILADDEFDNQVCIVTGGAQGLGAGIAEALGKRGGKVVVLDINAEAASMRVRSLREHGYEALPWEADVTNLAQLEAMVEAIGKEWGPPDILINNAGLFILDASDTMPLPDWKLQIEVMLTGPFLCTRAVIATMRARNRGAIVNTCSMSGIGAHPKRAAYNSAKAGLSMLTRVLATEWARDNVRVNAVAPGVIRTEILDRAIRMGAGELTVNLYEKRTPMGRIADVAEIAECVAFLASSKASYITGVTLVCDGGWLASPGIPMDLPNV
jgi:NAD(P)-dependent dehydrogenase (short-subunit alcohol dehydrogenase family)